MLLSTMNHTLPTGFPLQYHIISSLCIISDRITSPHIMSIMSAVVEQRDEYFVTFFLAVHFAVWTGQKCC